MDSEPGRTVSVLLTSGGTRLGVVGPFPVESRRWSDAGPVAAHLRSVLGVPAVVLRLLDVEGGGAGVDGHVTYHAEALHRPDTGLTAAPAPGEDERLRPHPLRARWATAPGLRDALRWADEALAAAGRPATGPVEQAKTWNLAGLFRIPTEPGPVWLKATAAFGVSEARVIALFAEVAPHLVPSVLAADDERRLMLTGHIPGDDCWGPSPDVVRAAVGGLVAAQAALAERGDRPPGRLPDRRPKLLIEAVGGLLAGAAADELSVEELARAHRLVGQLPSLVARLEDCGLPDTVVHGDFHPGNWRSDGRRVAVFDFADSYFGHPALDGLRPRAFLSADRWADAADHWAASWSAKVPGADPVRALDLAGPLAHLGNAVRYQEFLDGIEPSERRYHAGDPAAEIRAALVAADRAEPMA